jgi:tartrate dehydratase alpha subunit/fumarate hydratase class I-like protein
MQQEAISGTSSSSVTSRVDLRLILYQQTKALPNEKSLAEFLKDKLKYLGTSACPPYHLAIVIGGLSAEQTLKTVKLASVKYLDNLQTIASSSKGHMHANGQASRDVVAIGVILRSQIAERIGVHSS